MRKYFLYILLILFSISVEGQVKILFDASKAETAGNADWVIDADTHNLGFNNGPAVVGQGNESNPQILPTPGQSTVGASTAETFWEGGISAWGIECVKHGYWVETLPYNGQITYGNAGNAQDLTNYKVFVVCEPNILFTSAEKTAMMQFVQNGGGLFMVSDHDVSDRNNDGWDSPHIWDDFINNNSIQVNPFGFTFDYADFSQTTTNIPNLPTDPLLHGPMGNVTAAMWSNGTSMTLTPSANSSVTGVVYKTGSSFGNANVMVAHATYGSGKVVGFGDSSPCDDGTGDPNDQLYNGWTGDASGNHRLLIMNATIWLASSTGPVVTTLAATNITQTQATLNGSVNPNGASTSWHFEWGTTTAYGNNTPVVSAGSGTTTSNVNATITGLTSGTTYHFRLVGVAGTTTVYGSDLMFTTNCASFTLPFSENFSGTVIPSCWSQVDHQANGQVWAFGVMTGQTPLPALTGNYAFLNSGGYGSGNSQNADLITPTLDLSTYTTVNLSFNHYFKSYTGSSGTLSSSTDNGTTWTQIIQLTTTSATNPAVYNAAVASVAGHSQVRFKWNYTATWGYSWAIDDVLITGTTGGGPTLSVTPPNQNVTSPAGSTSFAVTSNGSWTVVSDQNWCLVNVQGTGNGTISANYSENTTLAPRVANITVTVAGISPVVVTVTQAGTLPTLQVTPANQNVAATAGSTAFFVTSNTGWTVSSNQSWCTVTPAGTGNGTIMAQYAAHNGTGLRVAYITVAVQGLAPVAVTVTQDGTTGMNDPVKDDIVIVPNPNDGHFEIRSDALNDWSFHVTILNDAGKVVLSQTYKGASSCKFNFENQTKGTYLVRIAGEGWSVVKEVVIR